jgi:protocatechuate 3,4-dioxygenase beta subunit
MTGSPFTRRRLLAGSALLAGGALFGRASFAQGSPPACVLTPQSTEGPFYFDPGQLRADITEGRPGVPLKLGLQVVEAGSCRPVDKARVDVWHADALGLYSGYRGQSDARNLSTVGETFMRGTQISDGAGQVAFSTVYPGWYRGRTAHIHFRVFLGERSAVTGQLYFPDALSDDVYATAAYRERSGKRETTNATDGLLRGRAGREWIAATEELADGYSARMAIGIAAG